MLDEIKKHELLALIALGCSRRAAARSVGCAPKIVRGEMARDAAFAERLRRAEQQMDIAMLRNIRAAAAKPQYWRAAAWALERLRPHTYGPRKPDTSTPEEVHDVIGRLVEAVREIMPAELHESLTRRVAVLIDGWSFAETEHAATGAEHGRD